MLTLAEPGQDCNPAITQIVNAAIAYADAVTARRIKAVNQQDHRAAVALLRSAVGNRLPAKQLTYLGDIIAEKDPAAYGARAGSRSQAQLLLARLDELAAWAEEELRR